MGERQPAKHHSSLATQASAFGTEGVLERSCSRAVAAWARADTGRSLWQLASGGSVPPCSVLSLPCAAFEPLFLAVRAAYRFRCVTVQSTHNLKAQPSFEDCCAKNKSGYLRIRATAVKERIEAVTNGQGRQGREDL